MSGREANRVYLGGLRVDPLLFKNESIDIPPLVGICSLMLRFFTAMCSGIWGGGISLVNSISGCSYAIFCERVSFRSGIGGPDSLILAVLGERGSRVKNSSSS